MYVYRVEHIATGLGPFASCFGFIMKCHAVPKISKIEKFAEQGIEPFFGCNKLDYLRNIVDKEYIGPELAKKICVSVYKAKKYCWFRDKENHNMIQVIFDKETAISKKRYRFDALTEGIKEELRID